MTPVLEAVPEHLHYKADDYDHGDLQMLMYQKHKRRRITGSPK
jgi:hypothetical protein